MFFVTALAKHTKVGLRVLFPMQHGPLFCFDLIDLTIVESRKKKHNNKETNRNGENNARMRKNRNKRFGRDSWKFFSFAVLRAPKYPRCHTERLLARYKFMNHNDAAMFRFLCDVGPNR